MKSHNQFPPEKVAEIGRLYAAGVKLREIAATVGCSIGGASAIARKTLGLKRRHLDQGLVPWRAIFAAYRSGKSCKAITDELNAAGIVISRDTISARLKRKGVKIRPSVTSYQPDELAAVARLLRKGLTGTQVGKVLGLSLNQVNHRRRRVLPPSRVKKLIPIDLAKVAEMRAQGMTWPQVATVFKCSVNCVTRRFFGLDKGWGRGKKPAQAVAS